MSVSQADQRTEHLGCESIETHERDKTLVTAFELVAAKFPSRIAIGSDVWQPTYRELNETANRVAHRLIACGGVGNRAAILMSHDAPMVAAVLGALKAGQIVVALDPGDPLSRLNVLIEDSQPSILIADAQHRGLATELAPTGCLILDFESEAAKGPAENPAIEILPEQTAFLVYTSGTTGRPKGVMKSHRQMVSQNVDYEEAIQCTEDDRIPLFAAVATGQGSSMLCWPLLNGAMLCPFSVKTRGVTGLADWIIDRGLTVYVSSASIFRALIKTIDDRLVFSNVRAVRLASEPVTADDVMAFRKHFPSTSVFVHLLMSSETPVIAWARWTGEDEIPEGVLPVGRLATRVEVSLVGDDGQPVARGGVGEIVVKSRDVASGYWRDPELTAKRFSSILDAQGTRLVWTGDLGRINANGMLEFCGRKDDRIKIRGNRIEVLEVERAFEKFPGIDRAAMVAIQRENHEPVLVAFVVKTTGASWTASRLRHAMRATLPAHMVPSRIVFLDSLPYNRGNKIDREALRQHALLDRGDIKGDEPQTETEVLLANIWAEALELADVGRDDDFFDLGGDSLIGAVVAAQIHAALGVELSLGSIADHSTLSGLAGYIDQCRLTAAAGAPPIVPVPRAASMPLSLAQEAMWPTCRSSSSTDVQCFRIVGPLDVEIFKECLGYLVERHEILRTTFGLVDGHPAQIIHRSAPLDFSVVDLAGRDDAEEQADAIFRNAGAQAFDLQTLPIMRHVLVKLGEDHYRLARVHNFMILDGHSIRTIENELATLYEARLQGLSPPLPNRAPLQYADYAVWQRQVIQPDSPYFKAVLSWWENLLSTPPSPTRLPFALLVRSTGREPSEGVLRWTLDEQAAKRLDEIARHVGTTNFVIRLAAFAALIADVTGNSTVAFGTFYDNRNRTEAQTIVGRFVNMVPIVLSYDAAKTFREWSQIVHERVFETLAHSELSFDKIKEQLWAAGTKRPETSISFMLSRDHSDQHFGNLTITKEPWIAGTMPSGCMMYVDGKKPENCQVRFDANRYDRKEMRALLGRYLRLIDTAAREPELPIGKLVALLGAKPLRWTFKKYSVTFYETLIAYYASSPFLKMIWRPVKRLVTSRG